MILEFGLDLKNLSRLDSEFGSHGLLPRFGLDLHLDIGVQKGLWAHGLVVSQG